MDYIPIACQHDKPSESRTTSPNKSNRSPMTGSPLTDPSPTLIRRPNEPAHFMSLVREVRPIPAALAKVEGASAEALVLRETYKTTYPESVYFERKLFDSQLRPTAKRTHCPLKGDASYWDVEVAGEWLNEAAWSYDDVLDHAPQLKQLCGMIAFSPKVLTASR